MNSLLFMETNPSALTKIWAKLSNTDDGSWLPLYVHMHDTCRIAEKLWAHWISDSTKKSIADSILENKCSTDAVKIVGFVAAAHDVGKCTPAFQTYIFNNKSTES